jgi:glycosyltransferase involved in cell wall biosynthesis
MYKPSGPTNPAPSGKTSAGKRRRLRRPAGGRRRIAAPGRARRVGSRRRIAGAVRGRRAGSQRRTGSGRLRRAGAQRPSALTPRRRGAKGRAARNGGRPGGRPHRGRLTGRKTGSARRHSPAARHHHLPAGPTLALERGVNLIGLARKEIGIGESCRLAAGALEAAGIPFGILNLPGVSAAREMDTTWAHKEMKSAVYRTNIIHLNPDTLRYAYQYFGRGVFRGRFNIGYWHWELPDLPDDFLQGFKLVQEVWAPSAFVCESIARKSPVPVVRIPHGIAPRPLPGIGRDHFGLPHDRFLFLTMYDTNSYRQRKNPQATIAAFQAAFEKNAPEVGLVLKVNNLQSSPSDLGILKQLTAGHDNIYIIDRTLSRREVDSLLDCTDCFVSLHRSEGFGLGLAEAMYLGKPVIGTNWSGNTDFMSESNSCPVRFTIVRVGRNYGPYKAHQHWAEPDIAHAADYMRRLVADSEWRQSIAANGQHTILTEFSPQAVGEMIRRRLTERGLI